MPEYFNNNGHTVYLPGPDGRTIQIKSKEKRHLSEFFDKYCSRGYIQRVGDQPKALTAHTAPKIIPRQQILINKSKVTPVSRMKPPPLIKNIGTNQAKTIGRVTAQNANSALNISLNQYTYTISNSIAIGILSYNRVNCLRRLIESIIKYTDLKRTVVFISDDCSADPDTIAYLDDLTKNHSNKFVVIKNTIRLGIAGNTNRLLTCVKRFKYSILLNDDVEILNHGWDSFYFNNMQRTGFNHYIYRQEGVYGAQIGESIQIAGIKHYKITAKPHGAVLALTHECIKAIGYFNTDYGFYGMEHVDWSTRIYEAKLQPSGYFDIDGSNQYFRIHKEPTSVENKSELFNKAKTVFANRKSGYIACPSECEVPKISYVIPCRDIDRSNAIRTVIDGIRSQMFPDIEIILIEHDHASIINVDQLQPIKYGLVLDNSPFNKSKAFNLGVSLATSSYVILHDADMVVHNTYTSIVYDKLQHCEACHLGNTVIYVGQESSNAIINNGIIDQSINCDRVVGYYEGGSLACHVKTYWAIGGFNEDFVGYGCEDTEFYNRLSNNSKWLENRTFDLLHLWHGRVDGWQECHKKNKALESKLFQIPMPMRVSAQRAQLKSKYNKFMETTDGNR